MAAIIGPEYWCHQCNETIVTVTGDEICCPRCNGGFVEEMETSPPRQSEPSVGSMDPPLVALLRERGLRRRRPENSDDLPPSVLVMEQPPIMMQLMQALGSTLTGLHISEDTEPERPEENGRIMVVDQRGFPLLMFQGAGAPVGVNTFGIPQVSGALGDYFIGPGLEQLLQRLAENDPNRYGTPPTAKEAVDSMPAVKITEEHLKADCSSECAVCKDDFAVGEETRQLPCKHLYHPDCIFPWLKLHSSCPVCRFQMPTDVEGSGKSQSQESASTSENSGGTNNNSGEEAGNGNGNRNINGWFQMSLPLSMISNLVNPVLGIRRNNNNSSRQDNSNVNCPNGNNNSTDHS